MLIGSFFEEEISQFQYIHFLFPSILFLALVIMLYNKWRFFKQRTFIKTKNDRLKQSTLFILGIIISFIMLYSLSNPSYFHFLMLFVGVGFVLNGLLFESTIQLYIQNGLLFIQYGNSTYYYIEKIDSYELKNGTLHIYFDDTRVEVDNVETSQSNMDKLTNYLKGFQEKSKN
ncbi:MAG: hypothetical protein CMB80_11385 [Flammeovirgaceae bacterium]|nr:hypothetical protein [Flammeovirgaceae bacterium]MBE60975.1 hypothetical protein [Flammeovirgaceae bacterium]HCX22314.1 hypothetical protein [Cytophagales bacterium]